MNNHRHLSSEEILDQISEGGSVFGAAGCETCEAEAASLSRFFAELQRVDAELVATTEWDDLLLRQRIRGALAHEKPYVRSIFDRFSIMRPAFVPALVAMIALAVWIPSSGRLNPLAAIATVDADVQTRLPVWSPLPEESEDEGLAVLTEWTPTEDELLIVRCRAACLAGLTNHEEETLFSDVAQDATHSPMPGASPL